MALEEELAQLPHEEEAVDLVQVEGRTPQGGGEGLGQHGNEPMGDGEGHREADGSQGEDPEAGEEDLEAEDSGKDGGAIQEEAAEADGFEETGFVPDASGPLDDPLVRRGLTVEGMFGVLAGMEADHGLEPAQDSAARGGEDEDQEVVEEGRDVHGWLCFF